MRDCRGGVRPGLAAKPIIDCDIVVAEVDVPAASAVLAGLGRGKSAMVQQILAAAGLTEAERASIDANQVPSHEQIPR